MVWGINVVLGIHIAIWGSTAIQLRVVGPHNLQNNEIHGQKMAHSVFPLPSNGPFDPSNDQRHRQNDGLLLGLSSSPDDHRHAGILRTTAHTGAVHVPLLLVARWHGHPSLGPQLLKLHADGIYGCSILDIYWNIV